MIKKAWLMKTGGLKLDQSILTLGKGYGKSVDVPVYSVLFDTNEGYILVDTGMHTGGLKDPEKIWGDRAKQLIPNLKESDDIVNQLAQLSIKASDVKIVINTHLHWDHTGGNRYFKKSKFYVQKAEYRYALYPDRALGASYMKNHFNHDLAYNLVEGDVDIVEGLRLLSTPGHTPGHQSVIATFEGGSHLLLGGDAVYTNDNIDKLIPPGNAYDYRMSIESLNKLDSIRKLTGAVVLPTHEPDSEFFTKASCLMDELIVLNGGE